MSWMEHAANMELIRNVLKKLDGEFKENRLLRRCATILIQAFQKQHKYIQMMKKTTPLKPQMNL
jgi:hypothetical protein